MTKASKENVEIEELQKLCEENKLIDKIKDAINVNAARKLIKAALPESKDVLKATVTSYIEKLKDTSSVNITEDLSLENISDKDKDKQKQKESQIITFTKDDEKNKETHEKSIYDKTEKKIQEQTSKKTSDGEDKKLDTTNLEVKEDGKIVGTSYGEKDGIYVNKNKLKEIDAAQHRINVLEENVKLLNVELEGFKQKLPSEQNEVKDKLMSQIPNLNELLNSGNDKITVSINKELLSKATKFVDAHSLISLETIIRGGYDLNSTIVQSILLAFIHQNSLL